MFKAHRMVCEGLRVVEGVLTSWMTVRLSKRVLKPKKGMSSHSMRQALQGIPVYKVSRYVYVHG